MATHIAMVIDASGSMSDIYKATLDGYKEYIQEQKKDDSDLTYISVTFFNTHAYVAQPLSDIQRVPDDLTALNYAPNGGTALYDAISYGVGAMERDVNKNDKAVVVVITDGYENSSRETTQQQVLDLIRTKEALGNWTFAYLGANQDAWAVGSTMGFQPGNTLRYAADYSGTVGTYSTLSASTSSLKRQGGGTSTKSFLTKDDGDVTGP